MADVLPGYTWDRRVARYRDTARGQFVSRRRIVSLMEQQVNHAEDRLGNILQQVHAGSIAPASAQTMMRDELRRLSLQNAALGKGGFDRLTQADYGRVGRQLRDSYQRSARLLNDLQTGRTSLAQAMSRIQGYTLEARRQFFAADRAAANQSDRMFEERRVLHARESCTDCISYAGRGWQPQGVLPLPGEGGTKCGAYCRCTIERRDITEEIREGRALA